MEHDAIWWLGYITMWLVVVYSVSLFLMRILMFLYSILDDIEEQLRKKMNDENK